MYSYFCLLLYVFISIYLYFRVSPILTIFFTLNHYYKTMIINHLSFCILVVN